MVCCLVSLLAVVREVVERYKDTEAHGIMGVGVSFRSEMSFAACETNSPAYLVFRTPNREGLFLKCAAWERIQRKERQRIKGRI